MKWKKFFTRKNKTTKYILFISMLMCNMVCFGQMKPDRYDTSYIKGFIVTVDTVRSISFIKPVIKMQIYVSKEIPCSTIYVWGGEDKKNVGTYSTISDYDSTIDYGPCGYNGFFAMYSSKYEGDTIIKKNCQSYSYGIFKELYFIPDKKKKRQLGKQYELKKQDYYGEMDEWVHKPLFILCV